MFPGIKAGDIQVHRSRIINKFPQCYTKAARIDEKNKFDSRVLKCCLEDRATAENLEICKMVLVGDMAVGKTSLLCRYGQRLFNKNCKATIGVDFEIERFVILNQPFTLEIWDTAGQERFQCLITTYLRSAKVVAVVFDVSEIQSLANAKKWLEAVQEENPDSSMITFLVGTKMDLLVPLAFKEIELEAIKIANSMNAEFWGVSAKTGENVEEFITRVAALSFESAVITQRQPVSQIIESSSSVSINSQPSQEEYKEKNKCCLLM